jgi:MoxR-like ATPase
MTDGLPLQSMPCLACFHLVSGGEVDSQSYVLDPVNAPERYQFAQGTALGLLTRHAVLLEGPAATGKSALIDFLSHRFNGQSPLRVINTDSTNVQDYVGSYLPQSSRDGGLPEFKICKGPLYRALEEGLVFFADEFNLAEPAVLNMLMVSEVALQQLVYL